MNCVHIQAITSVQESFVCLRNNLKNCGRILKKFSGNVNSGTKNKRLNFGGYPDQYLDPRFFLKEFFFFFAIALTSTVGGVGQRFVISECSLF